MIQIYTGEGKGKTTAAIGSAVRAAGAGMKVLFIQVLKDGSGSEVSVLEAIPKVTYKAFGQGQLIYPDTDLASEKLNTQEAMVFARQNIDNFDLIIIDELLSAVKLKIIPAKEVISLMGEVESEKELILTGHGLPKSIKDRAHLVTEMKPVLHYFKEGTKARKGIEW